jgi:hypothetical protein
VCVYVYVYIHTHTHINSDRIASKPKQCPGTALYTFAVYANNLRSSCMLVVQMVLYSARNAVCAYAYGDIHSLHAYPGSGIAARSLGCFLTHV